MPDSTGDTPDPQPPVPLAKPPPENLGSNLAKAPRANPPSVFNKKGVPPAAAPPGMADFMEWMKTFAGVPAEEGASPAGRSLIPKAQKKFSRRPAAADKPASPGLGAPSNEEAERSSEAASGADENVGSTIPPRMAPPDLSPVERKRRSREQPRNPLAVLFMQFLVFALVVGSFFLGRFTVSKQALATAIDSPAAHSSGEKTPVVLPPDLAAKVDQATVAENRGDYQHARALLKEVVQAGGKVNGLDYHLAELAVAEHDWPAVLPLLNASIAKGEKVAGSYNLRGTMLNQTSGPGKGLADLQLAAQLDPFNANFAFFVGEAMRRMGKPQAAQDYLRQALNRLSDRSQGSFYRLKLRLAQIESGQEQQFADEMAAQLALNPPPVDWLFTAAAEELHRGNFPAAAGYLAKARALVGQAEMNTRLRDYYFYSFADNKELAPFFQGLTRPVPVPTVAATPPLGLGVTSPQLPVPMETPNIP